MFPRPPSSRLARPAVEALEDRSLLSLSAVPFDISGLTLSNTSVYEFRPTGTAVGTFTTTESGSGHTFSYALASGAGSADNGSFTIGGNQLLTADAFDFAARPAYSIRVRSTDEAGNALEQPFTITVLDDPALTRSGPTLAVTTDYKFNPNTFSLTADPVRYGMTLNGVSLAVDTASVDRVTFQGPNMEVPGPPVIATLTGGTSLNTAELRPAQARLRGAGYQVSVTNVSEISAIGESYTALFYGSPGDYPDWFGAMPGDAHMYGPMPTDPLMYGVGYDNKAFGFKAAVALGSANSRSEATLYTGGEGDFVATPTYGYITAPGYYIQAAGFQTVNAYPSDSFKRLVGKSLRSSDSSGSDASRANVLAELQSEDTFPDSL
jgi:hypothetical protein